MVVLINGTITEPAAIVQLLVNNTDRRLMHVQHEVQRSSTGQQSVSSRTFTGMFWTSQLICV